jgi:ferredoxin
MKALDKPARTMHSSYYAIVDKQNCIACGACAERCHKDAITVDDLADVNPYRCIEMLFEVLSGCHIIYVLKG